MAQCRGTTRKGERCRRDARPGSDYCSIHVDQDAPEGAPGGDGAATDSGGMDDLMKTALGFALIGAILFFRLRR